MASWTSKFQLEGASRYEDAALLALRVVTVCSCSTRATTMFWTPCAWASSRRS